MCLPFKSETLLLSLSTKVKKPCWTRMRLLKFLRQKRESETEWSRLVSQISQLCKLWANWRHCLQTKVEHYWGKAPKMVLLPPQAQILMGMWTHTYTRMHRKEIKKQHTTQVLLSLLLRLHVVTFWREKYPWPFPSFAWLII